MSDKHTALSISQMARETGVSVDTLRYYEREQLLVAPVGRTGSDRRVYGARDVGWVNFITRLRRTGMGIADIREYTRLARLGERTNPERLALLEAHRMRVIAQLEETQSSLDAITYKIAEYSRKVASL
ncbi:MerR family transcriptional regulator [Mycetocola spongiae]|uniref:MerR family transcriptional regulator n=1 Tax=Mycetocola spongiae TaxID=2859226 RepID=UPI001CF115A1|nr:MerR family transcriptional regulator [Mycetocola spongiae]UCR90045.1 MerR family transcriptional regulator [Mycetocola spongiae]